MGGVATTKADKQFELAVVMPVRNEEKYLGKTLEQLSLQDFPLDKLEIVISDGASTDRTREVAEFFQDRFGSLSILNNPGQLAASGRNIGIKNSSAPHILILDGHTYLPDRTFLKDILETFESTGAECLCRPQPLDPPGINRFQRVVAICRGSLLGHNPGSEIYADYEGTVDPTASGAMYARSVFDTIGYFDEDFDACEDVDFNHRVAKVGIMSFLSPKLKVYYYPRSSIKRLWKQMLRYGEGRFRFARKHQDFSFGQLLASVPVLGILLMLTASLVWPQVRLVFLNLVAVYFLLVTVFSTWLAWRHRHFHCIFTGPLVFSTIHLGLGAGFLKALFSNILRR